jgi:hypothetical protein
MRNKAFWNAAIHRRFAALVSRHPFWNLECNSKSGNRFPHSKRRFGRVFLDLPVVPADINGTTRPAQGRSFSA